MERIVHLAGSRINRCLSIVLASCIVIFTTAALAQVPTATVSGPISGNPPGSPQGNFMLNPSAIDLQAYAYIEEEYFIEGSASRYSTPELATGEVIDSGHPYKTRFIVRRPQSQENFNGVLIVEWNNVTGGRDLDIDWWQSGEHLMREGYAFIAASPQRVGVQHMNQWDAERYGSLDVTAGGTITNDALSYDIFTAIASAAARPAEGAPDVLGGLRPHRLIATGHSQSASRLGNYINHVHALTPVFDGFMIHGGGGRLRDDQDVKIFKIMAETDMAGRAANPQPDSNNFRQWEVAGSSHVDIPFEIEFARMLALENTGEVPVEVSPREQACDLPPYSHVPFRYPMNAAFEHLRLWIAENTAPPSAPPLQVAQATSPLSFVRDEHGNILGGIRLSAHAVPVATNTGMNTGEGFCRLYGSHQPFDAETLRRLYPDHDSYVDAVRDVVAENVSAGYVLEYDATTIIREAEQSGIGNW